MNVLISGGSRGIGRAAAELFHKKGHNVAHTFFTTKPSAPGLAVRCDVRDPEQTAAFVRRAEEEFGPADAVVCCAGTVWTGLFQDTPDAELRRMMDTNFTGTFNLCRAAAPSLIHRKSGCIVTVASMWGVAGGACEAVYSASKGAVTAFTKALAKELAPSGIRANCLAPGAVETDMMKNVSPSDLEILLEETPLGRVASPEEMAGWIYFLASPESSFMTGQIISPNGGVVI